VVRPFRPLDSDVQGLPLRRVRFLEAAQQVDDDGDRGPFYNGRRGRRHRQQVEVLERPYGRRVLLH